MSRENKRIIFILLLLTAFLVFAPLFALKGAEFGGSDDAGSVMVEKIGGTFEPWFTPVLETMLHGGLPGEVESLIFCLQTGIGVGIFAFFTGRMVERKKWEDKEAGKEDA